MAYNFNELNMTVTNKNGVKTSVPIFSDIHNKFSGKKISILGDSISTFGGDANASMPKYSTSIWTYPGNNCRYPQANLLTNVEDTYWHKLITKLKMNLGINESWAGSLVSWDGTTESTNFGANKHGASLTRIGHLNENGEPDVILVYIGTNDIARNVTLGTFNTDSPINLTEAQIEALPVATFADAYRTMLIRLQYYYPFAKIVVVLPTYTTTYSDAKKTDEYCEVIKEACDYFGIKWLDLRTCGINMFNLSTYLGTDGIHPLASGMDLIYKYLLNAFLYEV